MTKFNYFTKKETSILQEAGIVSLSSFEGKKGGGTWACCLARHNKNGYRQGDGTIIKNRGMAKDYFAMIQDSKTMNQCDLFEKYSGMELGF